MTKTLSLLAAVTTAVGALAMAAPASAASFDAFTSFNGTQGAGGFYYGQVGTPFASSPFVEFAATTNCFIDGSVCLQSAANHDVPGVTKSTTPSFQYNSVNVPTDRLLLHPSADSNQSVEILFRAPTTGSYTFTGTFNIQDVNPSGVSVGFYDGATLIPLSVISSSNLSGSYSTTLFRNAGDFVGFVFNNDGVYYNDSTGFNFTASTGAVPEPATWAMMLAGFGMIGFAARRRAKPSVRVAHA